MPWRSMKVRRNVRAFSSRETCTNATLAVPYMRVSVLVPEGMYCRREISTDSRPQYIAKLSAARRPLLSGRVPTIDISVSLPCAACHVSRPKMACVGGAVHPAMASWQSSIGSADAPPFHCAPDEIVLVLDAL